MNPLRVLVVSYTFPPYAVVGSIRIAQFCRHLPESGIDPIVLTVEERFYESLDLSRSPSSSLQILRTSRMATPLEIYARAKRWLRHSPPGSVSGPSESETREKEAGWLRRNVIASFEIPDRYWGWYGPAIRRADDFLRRQPVDAVFSSGPPWISHLVARHVKRKFGVPWLADFRDPWASVKPLRKRPAWWHQLASRFEKSCMQTADRVLCNTDRLRDAFRSQYSNLDPQKFQTLTNGFEDLPIPAVEANRSRRLLLHLGSVYAHRRIDTFLTALADLVRSGRLDPSSFRVVFQGDIDPIHFAEAAKIAPELLQSQCIEFRPRVGWEQAWKLLWESDLLLLFQGSHQLQVPAKFFEYLQTGVPMFAVTEEGALTDVLVASGSGIWAHAGSAEEIAEGLLKALCLPRRSPEEVKQRLSPQYDYRALTKQLGSWIRDAAANPSSRDGKTE